MMLTSSEENYLKTIYNQGVVSKQNISTNSIAMKLKTKPSSVTDMLQKLADKELIHYQKYKGVSLTQEGKKAAVNVIRKHRLWECFLVSKLDFSWDEVHEVAEQLEHIKSDKLIDTLDEFLGYPKHDPHGDPIPDKNGNIAHHKKTMLSSINENEYCIAIGLKLSSNDFLKYLDSISFELGNEIFVKKIHDFDNTMEIEMLNKRITISHQTANNIYVKIL